MGKNRQRLDWQTVDTLVNELSKDAPDEGLVESLMTQVGLTYNRDPVIRMGAVLEVLSRENSSRSRRDNESSL